MVLIDGDHARLGRLERSDGELLRRFFLRLSPKTVYRRFLSPIARPEQAQPQRLLDVDHRDREALCALENGEIVGVARYTRRPGTDRAELAVVVADAWQRQGLATRLVSVLAADARANGIAEFEVTALAENRPVLALLVRLRPTAALQRCGAVLEGSIAIGSEA